MPRHVAARGVAAANLALVTWAMAAAACSGDDAGERATDALPVIETAPDLLAGVTAAPRTLASAGAEFLDDVLADDVVTAAELAEAYQRYVDCLAAEGGSGTYAYDVELQIPLSLDWEVDEAQSGGIGASGLSLSCSRDHLGDLVDRYEADNPPPPDLADLQLANLTGCVEGVSPQAAANLPDAVTLDTVGTLPFIGDLQLGGIVVDVPEEEIEPVNRCIESLGATWRQFG